MGCWFWGIIAGLGVRLSCLMASQVADRKRCWRRGWRDWRRRRRRSCHGMRSRFFVRVGRQLQRTGTNKVQKQELREQRVDPERVGKTGDKLFWLQGWRYVRFGKREWGDVEGGKVKL
ncbi:hypothetical protein LTS18_006254 [Coniosporium uncinatum]|uniref:Uncharacterized protein n=1 Tax=Coniosporium uncinatum TaxID=93489 RepID=A0ACC3DAY6_9PEZI|nr:hypothetical protein LTS18_006254 [Coniosporium uncinatum]